MGDPKINRVSGGLRFHVGVSPLVAAKEEALRKASQTAVVRVAEKIIQLHSKGMPIEAIVAAVSAEFLEAVDHVESELA